MGLIRFESIWSLKNPNPIENAFLKMLFLNPTLNIFQMQRLYIFLKK